MSVVPGQARSPCVLCPSQRYDDGSVIPLYHRHHSSYADRISSLTGAVFSPGCKCVHSSQIGGRLRVCVSASALHEFWKPWDGLITYRGNPFHVDYTSIPGSTILELLGAFQLDYETVNQPLDVVLVIISRL
jgi:hypothetical protein